MFERPHLQSLINRLSESRKFIQVIIGPRQVGKTTLVGQLLKKINAPSMFVSADNAGPHATWLVQQWEAARIRCKANDGKEMILVIDEIQKIHDWSEKVKFLWDEDSRNDLQLKVLILGSSSLLLQQGLSESLAGRFEKTYMGHWSYKEMNDAFGWDASKYVWFGGYPGAASLIDDEKRWKSYVVDSLIETSISKDILLMTRVDKPALMKRLFELGCLYSSQILSYTKMLGQLQDAKNTTTLSHYLTLLGNAGLLSGVEKYSPNIIRQRSSSPKFNVHNNALMTAQMQINFAEGSNDKKLLGRLVESCIGAHLINHSITEGYDLFYWKEGNDEIDFVLSKNGSAIALEVKTGDEKFNSGMNAFQKKYNPYKILLLGDQGLPWQEFLNINPSNLF